MDPGTHSNDDDDHPIHGLARAGHAMSYWHLMIHLWPFSGVWRLFRLPLTLCCQPSPGDGQQGQTLRKLIVDWNLKYWESIGSGSKIADTPIAQTCTSRAVAPGSPMLNLCQVLLLSFQPNLDFQVPILVVLSFATSFAGLCILHRFWHNLIKRLI